MREIIFILALVVAMPLWAGAGEASPKVGADGASLVLDQGSGARKPAASGDTLHELLGQEVQVFILNHKTRIWPRMVYRSGPSFWSGKTNPQVEALIAKYARLYGVDPSLVRAVMRHESAFNPGAVSPKGAQGLMQLMPGTAALMGVTNPFDPEQNIAGGVGYLRRCLDRFQHNVPLAVAAYNAGPEAVAKYCTIPPYAETQLFVNHVMGSYLGQAPQGNPAAGAKNPAPAGKGAKMVTGPDQPPPGEKPAKEARRPKAKIIEVKSLKAKPQQTQPD